MSDDKLNEVTGGALSRRGLAKAAAWGAPAVMMMGAAPKCQFSLHDGVPEACTEGWFYIDQRDVSGQSLLDRGSFHYIGDGVDLPELTWTVQYVPVPNNDNVVVKDQREIRAEKHEYGTNRAEMPLSGDLKKNDYDPETGIVTLTFTSAPVKKREGITWTAGFKVFNSWGPNNRADKVIFRAVDPSGNQVVYYDTILQASPDKRWNSNLNKRQNEQNGWKSAQDGRV